MTSVQDIAEFIGGLEAKPLAVVEERCMRVRNRNSACTACKDVCPEKDAIRFGRNNLAVDFDLCMGCSACTTVCPTEALVPIAPTDTDLAAHITDAVMYVGEKSGPPEVVIACARIASKNLADPRTFTEVPCLCRIDESLLLDLAAHGIPWVSLVDGNCSTCRFRSTQQTTNTIVECTNDTLEELGSSMRVECTSSFPSFCSLESEKAVLASTRRGFFGAVRKDTKDVAFEAAKRALNINEPYIPVLKRIQSQDGVLPYLQSLRHEKVLTSISTVALNSVGEVPQGIASGRIHLQYIGNISIDEGACSACGVCATFCPTAALVKQSRKDAKAQGADLLLDFFWDRCIGCGACADVCLKKCIDVHDSLDLSLLANPNTSRHYFLLKH